MRSWRTTSQNLMNISRIDHQQQPNATYTILFWESYELGFVFEIRGVRLRFCDVCHRARRLWSGQRISPLWSRSPDRPVWCHSSASKNCPQNRTAQRGKSNHNLIRVTMMRLIGIRQLSVSGVQLNSHSKWHLWIWKFSASPECQPLVSAGGPACWQPVTGSLKDAPGRTVKPESCVIDFTGG